MISNRKWIAVALVLLGVLVGLRRLERRYVVPPPPPTPAPVLPQTDTTPEPSWVPPPASTQAATLLPPPEPKIEAPPAIEEEPPVAQEPAPATDPVSEAERKGRALRTLPFGQVEAYCRKEFKPQEILAAYGAEHYFSEMGAYAVCLQLGAAPGTEGLCQALPNTRTVARNEAGMPESRARDCESRLSSYRFNWGLVKGAPRDELRMHMSNFLSRGLPVDAVLDAYIGAYKSGALPYDKYPDASRKGYMNFLIGPRSCVAIEDRSRRLDCLINAGAVQAFKTGNPKLCQEDDAGCRAALLGAKACEPLGKKIVNEFCKALPGILNPGGGHPKDRQAGEGQ